jgi:lactoylglutathione lyase
MTRKETAMKFVHAATRTKDPDAAARFYELLGMRESRRSELTKNKATLIFMEPPDGNFAIELVYNWGKDTSYDGGERFGHFAFHVEDLDGTYKRVVAGGGQEVGRPPAPLQGEGPRIAFVADPDGNWIELIEHEGS